MCFAIAPCPIREDFDAWNETSIQSLIVDLSGINGESARRKAIKKRSKFLKWSNRLSAWTESQLSFDLVAARSLLMS